MTTPPTGTVTFLFTDIAGSTRLWEERPDEMRAALAEHDALLRGAIEAHGGYVFSTGGDGFAVAFSRAGDAIDAASRAQAALAGHPMIRVRMGIHTGEVQEREGDYFGPAVNRAARIMAAGHGGQVLLSSVTAALASGVDIVDLGERRLRDLSTAERLFQIGAEDFPPLRTIDRYETNLPIQLTGFVGREDELARLIERLADSRLVTLTGPGGIGKTRLAFQAAAELLPRFGDGVWLVELATVVDPAAVASAVADILRVREHPIEPLLETLAASIGRRPMLLLLDNCEHVVASAAQLVERLMSSCPQLVVLATSREALIVTGEQVWPVRPLSVPPTTDVARAESFEAVELFVRRATDARPDFSLGVENSTAVIDICRRLDGIPLALELAAARVSSMTPAEISSRLDRRFRLLRGGRRNAVERHQALASTIDWSYDLLDADERMLFTRLSVFADGCSLAAAEAVCGGDGIDEADVVDLLRELVSKSMVVADGAGSTRYRLLETLRQYAADRLHDAGDAERSHRRHAHYFAALAVDVCPHRSGREAEGFETLTVEAANLAAAFDWLLEDRDGERLEALCVSQMWHWELFAGEEGRRRFTAVIDSGVDVANPDEFLAEAAWAHVFAGHLDRGEQLALESIEWSTQHDRDPRPAAMFARASVISWSSADFGLAVEAFRDAANASDRIADLFWMAASRIGSVISTFFAGRVLDAMTAFDEGRQLAQRAQVPALVVLADMSYAVGFVETDPARAVDLLDSIRPRLVGAFVQERYFLFVAQAHARMGHWHEALDANRDACTLAHRAVDRPVLLSGLLGVARAFAQLGRPGEAARLLGFYNDRRPAWGHAGKHWEAQHLHELQGGLASALGSDSYEALVAEGRSLAIDDALDAVDRTIGDLDRQEAGVVDA